MRMFNFMPLFYTSKNAKLLTEENEEEKTVLIKITGVTGIR